MKKSFNIILLAFCLPIFLINLQAADRQKIKDNMLKRLPRITELKKDGKIGEDYLGYLSVRETISAADQNVVDQENADRKTVYEFIAKQQGARSEQVGKQRAKQLFDRSRSGEYIKKEDGTWSQK